MDPKGNDMAGDELANLKPTHLMDWLLQGYVHCQHGTQEWCESYLRGAHDYIVALEAARLSRSTSTEAGRLPFVVKYRRTDGVAWIAMAAFDQEGPAERYCAWCAAESSPWEYCVVEDRESVMIDHDVIYLQPLCDGCIGYEGRMWCQDDQGPCEECGAKWVKFIRTETAQKQPTPSDSNVNETGADAG